jgi:hypothetical protein
MDALGILNLKIAQTFEIFKEIYALLDIPFWLSQVFFICSI